MEIRYSEVKSEGNTLNIGVAHGNVQPLLKQAANEMRVRDCVSKATLTALYRTSFNTRVMVVCCTVIHASRK